MRNFTNRLITTSDFYPATNDYFLNRLKKEYPIQQLTEDDLFFTDEIEDDRINTVAHLADYDWMSYRYDTRFPTKKLGTLVVYFDYCGCTVCEMVVKQYLPQELTGYDYNYYVLHHYNFPVKMFDEYYIKDLESRIKNVGDKHYAYNMGDIVLEWFNRVLIEGEVEKIDQLRSPKFHWDFVMSQNERIKEDT